jgi:hypothetical protein
MTYVLLDDHPCMSTHGTIESPVTEAQDLAPLLGNAKGYTSRVPKVGAPRWPIEWPQLCDLTGNAHERCVGRLDFRAGTSIRNKYSCGPVVTRTKTLPHIRGGRRGTESAANKLHFQQLRLHLLLGDLLTGACGPLTSGASTYHSLEILLEKFTSTETWFLCRMRSNPSPDK